MSALPTICSFWHGELSYLARICLNSFAEKGHEVVLFCYEEPQGLPAGVKWETAEAILPQDQMFFYKGTRTPAVFADLFRLELMVQERGIWVDCDVYCVRPFSGLPEYVFGYENHPSLRNGFRAQVNQAVFACPGGSELLARLTEVFTSKEIPPGLAPWRYWEVVIRRGLGEAVPVHHMQFGATGPAPLNYYIPRLGLNEFVQAKDVFYPIDYGGAHKLLETGSRIEDFITDRTLGVHIWNSALTGRQTKALREPEPGSFLAEELKRLAGAPGR